MTSQVITAGFALLKPGQFGRIGREKHVRFLFKPGLFPDLIGDLLMARGYKPPAPTGKLSMLIKPAKVKYSYGWRVLSCFT